MRKQSLQRSQLTHPAPDPTLVKVALSLITMLSHATNSVTECVGTLKSLNLPPSALLTANGDITRTRNDLINASQALGRILQEMNPDAASTWNGVLTASLPAGFVVPSPLEVGLIKEVATKSHAATQTDEIRPAPPPPPPPQIMSPTRLALDTKTLRWRRGKVLGQGAYGTVHMGIDEATRELLAVKSIAFNPTDRDVKYKVTLLQREIAVMRAIEHPNLVKFYGAEKVDTTVFIFMEYVAGGSLDSLLKSFGPMSGEMIKPYLRQLLEGLSYLHQNHIIHRDIKGANILITPDGTAKLSDFGAAALVDDANATQRKSMCGTPFWMSPEVVRAEGHNWSADIWSLGCTVLEMLTGKPPFAHLNLNQFGVMNLLTSLEGDPPLPIDLAPQPVEFIRACLKVDKTQRPTAKQLLSHPFLQTGEGGGEDTPEITRVKTWVRQKTNDPDPEKDFDGTTKESAVLQTPDKAVGESFRERL